MKMNRTTSNNNTTNGNNSFYSGNFTAELRSNSNNTNQLFNAIRKNPDLWNSYNMDNNNNDNAADRSDSNSKPVMVNNKPLISPSLPSSSSVSSVVSSVVPKNADPNCLLTPNTSTSNISSPIPPSQLSTNTSSGSNSQYAVNLQHRKRYSTSSIITDHLTGTTGITAPNTSHPNRIINPRSRSRSRSRHGSFASYQKIITWFN
ncbi:unnamed protein product [[Candida] boidinii]|nr:unnamed protein product [[Candida] boidinii]